jgi:hypothetical protein
MFCACSPPQEPSSPLTSPRHASDMHLCCSDGLSWPECLGSLTSPRSLLPHRGERRRVNLFTTSAPGSGDELRLAQCPPRAGPGLSHGGQMTTESKWGPSCSPRELLDTPPFQSSQAPPGQREGGEGSRFRPLLAPPLTRGQQGSSPPTTLSLPSQAHTPKHPSRDHSQPSGTSQLGQMPSQNVTLSVTCMAPNTSRK